MNGKPVKTKKDKGGRAGGRARQRRSDFHGTFVGGANATSVGLTGRWDGVERGAEARPARDVYVNYGSPLRFLLSGGVEMEIRDQLGSPGEFTATNDSLALFIQS